MFSGEVTPDEVWDCIQHFPRDSATVAAIYADPETALSDVIAEPTLADYPPAVEALAAVHDLLASLLANVIALGGGKPPKIPSYPRPGEARRQQLKAQRHEQARAEWNELLGQLGITT